MKIILYESAQRISKIFFFHHEKTEFTDISLNHLVMFFFLYSGEKFQSLVSNTNFLSITLNVNKKLVPFGGKAKF